MNRTRLDTVTATDALLSVLEAADRLHVDVADAYRMIFCGQLQAVPGPDGRFLVRAEDLPEPLRHPPV